MSSETFLTPGNTVPDKHAPALQGLQSLSAKHDPSDNDFQRQGAKPAPLLSVADSMWIITKASIPPVFTNVLIQFIMLSILYFIG